MKNLFITFEGLDGSGKDTQMTNVLNFLKDKNKYLNFWITREPTNLSREGVEISNLLKSSKKILSKEITTKLYVKDRIKHSKKIKEYLQDGFVLCSRYDFSTFTYQHIQGYEIEKLYNLHKYESKNGALIPGITIVFIVNPKISLNRVKERSQKKEFFEKIEFLNEVFKVQKKIIKYLKEKDNRTIITIDASKNIESVKEEVMRKLKKFLK